MRLVLAIVFLLLAVPAWAEDVPQAGPQAAGLGALLDQSVMSPQGDSLGVLKSIAVHVETGATPWGVVASGRNIVVIPVRALAFDGLGLLTLGLSAEEFARAPRWRSTDLAQLGQPAAVRRIAAAYGFDPAGSPRALKANGGGTPFRLLGIPLPSSAPEVRMIGDPVTTMRDVPVGTIVDVLIELKAAKVRLVAVENDGRRLGLPYAGLVWQANARTFTTTLEPDELRRQPPGDWPEREMVTLIEESPPVD